MKCQATATGYDGIAQREPGDIFELSEEQAGIPPFPNEPHRFVWFEVIGESKDETPEPKNETPAGGLTFAQAAGQFSTDEDKLPAYEDELPV